MQIIAFDFGTKRIGVAVGQQITATATPLPALHANDGIPNWGQIAALFKEWQPQLLVVGLPLNMDGSEQEMTQRAKKFANRLHGRFNLPFVMQDERLTSREVKQQLFEDYGYRALKKAQIDSLAACLILEDWFNQQTQSG